MRASLRYLQAGLIMGLFLYLLPAKSFAQTQVAWWQFQSIDTMKYSRDLAREKLKSSEFDSIIDRQVGSIAAAGATHVAIGTPYDEEFFPFLRRWVDSARRHNLLVWFRGNWSGWEGWFDYPDISRPDHIAKTREFISSHPDLFVDGDVFTACPECENGGPGDPRSTGDVSGHRRFLLDLHLAASQSFRGIGKSVNSGYFSMNGDVARLVMDPPTVKALGGVVVIDHYVKTPGQLISDIRELAGVTQGKVLLGEFGAPIPDIHGSLDRDQQAEWIRETLSLMVAEPSVAGINYWTSVGGTTELWSESGREYPAAKVVGSFYRPETTALSIRDEIQRPVPEATAELIGRSYSSRRGVVMIPHSPREKIRVSAPGFDPVEFTLNEDPASEVIYLKKTHEGFWFKLLKLLHGLQGSKIN